MLLIAVQAESPSSPFHTSLALALVTGMPVQTIEIV